MSDARLFGAVAGGLVAGLGLTAMLVAGERKSGKPSELANSNGQPRPASVSTRPKRRPFQAQGSRR